MTTSSWIQSCCCGKLSSSEGTHQQLNSCVVVQFSDVRLHRVVSRPEVGCGPEVALCAFPEQSDVHGVACAGPEGEEDVVVIVGGSIAGNAEVSGDSSAVPGGDLVDVAYPNGIVVGL